MKRNDKGKKLKEGKRKLEKKRKVVRLENKYMRRKFDFDM